MLIGSVSQNVFLCEVACVLLVCSMLVSVAAPQTMRSGEPELVLIKYVDGQKRKEGNLCV